MQERKPSRILARLNEAVSQQRRDGVFCTVSFVRLKPGGSGARLTVCCGGHPLPFVVRADGSVESAGAPGTLLGIFGDPDLADKALDVGPGDTIVLYTDGVIEERAPGAVFGRERLASLLESCAGMDASAMAEAIDRAVMGFQPGPPRDDIAILVGRILP
jgi:serine phosphatase RsbU (regulator of sigma subunit)